MLRLFGHYIDRRMAVLAAGDALILLAFFYVGYFTSYANPDTFASELALYLPQATLFAGAAMLSMVAIGLYERGIISEGIGWQIPRMPGLGEVDWSVFFSGLYQVGYDGPIIIEHEDRRFEGSDDKVKRGFLLARDVLRAYVK